MKTTIKNFNDVKPNQIQAQNETAMTTYYIDGIQYFFERNAKGTMILVNKRRAKKYNFSPKNQ
ncbi:MAG: hypothetical protein ACUZ8H_01505 [Candidatus Anammoxibacter sp.]